MAYTIVPMRPEHIAILGPMVEQQFDYAPDPLATQCFLASMNQDEYADMLMQHQIRSLTYFVALDEHENPIGVSGCYETTEDFKEAAWLGWFFVREDHRREGIGTALLHSAVQHGRQMGKKIYKLYTSTHPKEEAAQAFYERHGFKEFHRDEPETCRDGKDVQTIYRQKEI